MYITGWNVSEICTDLKLSRFKVKKDLVLGLKIIHKMLEKEKYFKGKGLPKWMINKKI